MTRALGLSIALAAMLVASPALAVTFNIDVLNNDHYAGAPGLGGEVFVPEAPDSAPALTNTTGTVYTISPPALSPVPPGTPSVSGQYRSPWQYTESGSDVPYEPIGAYTSVQANSSGDLFFGLGANLTGLSLVWGSPDSYNEIEFFLNGIEVASLTGSDVGAPAFGVNFVVLTLIEGVFDTVRFWSHGANAFELANVRTFPNNIDPVVPLPAGLILLLSGLAGLGFLGRARAKSF